MHLKIMTNWFLAGLLLVMAMPKIFVAILPPNSIKNARGAATSAVPTYLIMPVSIISRYEFVAEVSEAELSSDFAAY
jgi:hypothetical protein